MDDEQVMGEVQVTKGSKHTVSEKAKDLALRCKSACVRIYANVRASETLAQFSRKVVENKRKIVVAAIAVLVVVGIGAASNYALDWWKYRNEAPTFASLRKAELAGTGQVGTKIVMGDLEITLQNVTEGSYRPLELDAQGNRVTKGYLSAEVMIFNTGYSDKYNLLFGLEDETGGQYERDTDLEFYEKSLKDFGPAREIYPRTIREGHLNFQAPDPSAKSLTLIILNEATNKKVIFDINR